MFFLKKIKFFLTNFFADILRNSVFFDKLNMFFLSEICGISFWLLVIAYSVINKSVGFLTLFGIFNVIVFLILIFSE